MAGPTVLLYNLDSEKGRRIKLLCLPLKIRARNVLPREYALTLSELLQNKGPAPVEQEPFSDEMLVMADLSPAQMNRLLQGFRKRKIPPVPLKAVLTATNAEWDSRKLWEELKREHEAMLRGESAHEN